MSNLKHTPAPWTINKNTIVLLSQGNTITVRGMALNMGSNHSEEINANQKLIAASPELLEALSGVIGFFNLDTYEVGTPEFDYCQHIKKVIKKATEL